MNDKVKYLLVGLAAAAMLSIALITVDYSHVGGIAGPGLDSGTIFSVWDLPNGKILTNVNRGTLMIGNMPDKGHQVMVDRYELRFRFEEKDLLSPLWQFVLVQPSGS
jgi:hypothetical protein